MDNTQKPIRDKSGAIASVIEQVRETDSDELTLINRGIGDEEAQAIAKLDQLTQLKLSANNIGDEGARALAELKNLTRLDLGGNRIGDEGVKALTNLKNLRHLDLAGNQVGVEGVRALTALKDLTRLSLGGNDISDEGVRALTELKDVDSLHLDGSGIGDEGARALAKFGSLSHLGVGGNRIGENGARALANLRSLTSLNIGDNRIGDEGARALADLEALTRLHITSNGIGPEGACALATLKGLTSLNLSGNYIGNEGARALAQLTNLEKLLLLDNRIGEEGARALLDGLAHSPASERLQKLDLRDNYDLSSILPQETLNTKDAQAILAAYRSVCSAESNENLQPLREAKLVLVGDEAVGKTSLRRFLVDGKSRDPDEPSTHDIEMVRWPLPQTSLTVNVWDFGGQQIMHGTHRYFLSERTLYLLVLSDRREDDRSVYKWLEAVENYAGDAPVIIAINKSEGSGLGLQIDKTALEEKYSDRIVDILRTSCVDTDEARDSIQSLTDCIRETLTSDEWMKHVRDPIPASWRQVKDVLRERAAEKSVVPMSDFVQLCADPPAASKELEAVTDEDEQRALLRLLNDIGVVVAHGLNSDTDVSLPDVTLLDPNWLTTAIYTLITHDKIREEQHGRFDCDQLDDLLDDPEEYPPRRHGFILEMMTHESFGLCFELPDEPGCYLIPEALPTDEPEYRNVDTSLAFRYDYKRLPSGLLPRFVVEAHRFLTAQETLWRTGAVLEVEKCDVLVRGDLEDNRVEIRVDGPKRRRRSALDIVRKHIERVHDRFDDINVTPMVPLTDRQDREKDLAVDYDLLRRLEEEDGPGHQFLPSADASRKYTVRELLDGVRPKHRSRIASSERDSNSDDCSNMQPVPDSPGRGRIRPRDESFTILHLSDLHMSESRVDEVEFVLKAFWEDLRRCHQKHGLSPDLICFTGDIGHAGKPEEFKLARKLLFEPLLEKYDLDKSRLVWCPGNHDVDQSEVSTYREKGVDQELEDWKTVKNHLAEHKYRSTCLKRLEAYAEFTDEFFDDRSPTADETAYLTCHDYQIGETTVGVAALNSSWRSSDKDDKGKLWVGDQQLRDAVDAVENADIAIALMHHPFDWLHQGNRAQRMCSRNFDVVLRGHVHSPGKIHLRHMSRGKCLVLPTSALFQGRESDANYWEGYSWVRLADDANKIHVRRAIDNGEQFISDNQSAPPDGVFRPEFP